MIQVSCHQCERSFKVADQYAGKSGKCPNCQIVIRIPKAELIEPRPGDNGQLLVDLAPPPSPTKVEAAPALSGEALTAKVLGAFQGTIEPVTTSLSYRLGVMLVSLLMLILPLIYLSLIVAVAYVVYLHLVNDIGMLQVRGSGRAQAFVLLLYLSPAFIGGTLVFFMVKPLFAPAAKGYGTRSLTRDGEPLLFAFVDHVCNAIGAPKPRRIDVDCEVNASASFRNGLISMLSRDLVLTIGVPLAAGMTMRQFAGVLAHEFGHFSQGTGMRLSYLIRMINAWFERVVYERDQWDEWLEVTARSVDIRIAIFLWATMLFVWLTRKILWVLMMIGNAASSVFSREMEFDADRYQARVMGSDAFEACYVQVVTLSVANQGARSDLRDFMREGRLGDNLPKLMMENVRQILPAGHAKIRAMVAEEKTKWHNTHPSGPERIASALRDQAPGIFRLELPASRLFANFDALGRNVTWDLYRGIFGQQFSQKDMHNTDELIARLGKTQQNNEAIDRYYQGCFSVLRRLPLPAAQPCAPAQPQQTLNRLKQARPAMLAEVPRYREMLKEFDEADTRLIEISQVVELLNAQISLKAKDFKVPVSSTSAAYRAREEAQIVKARLEDKLQVFEDAAGERLYAALQLLFVPQVAARVENPAGLQADCARYHEALITLQPHLGSILKLRHAHASLGALLGALQQHRNNQTLIEMIHSSMKELFREVNGVREELVRLPYPFDHAKGETNIGVYCAPNRAISDDLGSIFDASSGILEGAIPIYVRLLGHLVAIAEQVETAVGLPKLDKPVDP